MAANNNVSRKRRSSILKTKPRAPFTELEFNPPTPEISTKSRRVSFSKKTGVAEFVVNEATTTWRNFYEEQNRTLESSGNESEAHKHSVNRSIHQQFHEVEAEIDHTTLGNPGIKSGANLAAFSDMNFTEEFANLDCLVNDNSVKPAVKQFEMSVIAQRSNKFTNTFQVPVISEHTGRIEVDLSMKQFATQKDLEDDLSDIAKDVERSNRSAIGQNSFMQDFNQSCYIEVDLNETKGLRRNDISDMSITDTIQSPKFQACKNFDAPQSKSTNLDWIIDKENIVVESFPKSPTETICHSKENVLVFDGKKLKVANINDKLDDILSEPLPERKTLNRPKTGQLNSNSLSLISEDILRSQTNDICMENVSKINITLSQDNSTHQHLMHKSMSQQMSMMPDISLVNNCIDNPSMNITNKVPGMSIIENSFNVNKSMGIEFTEGNLGHSSMRLPRLASESKLDIVNTKTKLDSQKGAYCDSPSLELEIPIVQLAEKLPILCQSKPAEPPKRKTIILNQDDDLPNFTLDIPPQFDQRSLNSFHKNVVFETEDSMPSMSTTQAILREIQEASGMFKNAEELRKNVEDNAMTHQSMTKTDKLLVGSKILKDTMHDSATKELIPQNMATSKTRQTILDQYQEDNLADLSIILTVPSNPAGHENHPLIVFDKESDNSDISATKPFLAKSIVQERRTTVLDDTVVFDNENDNGNMSTTQAFRSKEIVQQKHSTIVFDRDSQDGIMSVTQGVLTKPVAQQKRQTIVFDKEYDNGNMSITQAVPSNEIVQQKCQTIVFDKENIEGYMSVTQAMHTKPIVQQKRHTIVFDRDNDDENMSVTQAIPTKPIFQQKRQTIVFDKEKDNGNISITQAIQSKEIVNQKRQTIVFDGDSHDGNMSVTQAVTPKPVVQQKRQTIVFDRVNDDGNMSVTQAIPTKPIFQQKRQTIVFDKENDNENMSITQAIQSKEIVNKKRQTIVFDRDSHDGNMSVTQAVTTKPVVQQKRHTIVFDRDNDDGNMSVTQAILTKPIFQQKRQTIVFDKENDNGNMSITQAIQSKEIVNQKRQTIVFDGDSHDGNMSVTQAVTTKPVVQQKRQTIVFDRVNDDGNMSVTQAIPTKPIFQQKRQTIVFDKENDNRNMSITQAIQSKEIVNKKRQTIVFDRDSHDGNMSVTQAVTTKPVVQQKRHTIVFDRDNDDGNMSVTQAILTKPIFQQKRQTIVFDKENDNGNMSITQAIQSKEIVNQKRQTIVFDGDSHDGNMSVTQAVTTKPVVQQKRQTIVFDRVNDDGNMSVTQAIPTKPIFQQKRQTIVFDKENDNRNMSITQAIQSKEIVQQERQTIVFDGDSHDGNMSVVQAVTTKPVAQQKRQTIVFDKENDNGNMSITQAIQSKEIVQQRCETIVFDRDSHDGNMSVTQAVTSKPVVQQKRQTIVFERDYDDGNMSVTQAIPTKPISQQKRQTIVFDKENDNGNMSITQAIQSKEIVQQKHQTIVFDGDSHDGNMSVVQAVTTKPVAQQKRQTIVFDKENDNGNMSITQAIQSNEIVQQKRQTIVFDRDNDDGNMSVTQVILKKAIAPQKRQTIVFDRENDNGNMSITQAIPNKEIVQQKRQTIVSDRDSHDGNMSVTQAVLTKPVVQQKRQTIVFEKESDIGNMSVTQSIPTNPIFQQKRQTIVFGKENDHGNMSITQAIPSKEIVQQRCETIVFDRDSHDGNMSVTQAVITKPAVQQKRQTIVFDKENENMSITQAIPSKEIVQQKGSTITFDRDNVDGNMPVTQAISSKPLFEQVKRKTIVFDKESDDGNMSMTKDVPKKIGIDNNKKSQIMTYDESDDLANISITQAVASAIPNDKWRETLFEQMNELPVTLSNKPLTVVDKENTLPSLPITQGILDKNKENRKSTYGQSSSVSVNVGKLIGQENVQSIHYNHNDVNIDESHKPDTDKSKMYDQSHMTDTSVTQEMPQVISKEKSQVTSFLGETKPDIIISEEKRKTILYKKNEEAIKHQIKPASVNNEICKTINLENNDEILSNTSKPYVIVGEEKCTTIIYENDTYLPEISVTGKLIGQENVQSIHYNHNDVNIDESHKPVTDKSKMYDQSHMTDTSVTLEMPQGISKERSQVTSFLGETKPDIIISEEKRKTILYKKNEEAIKHQIKPASVNNETCKTINLENNDEILSNTSKPHVIVGEEKCTTIIYENDTYLPEISVTGKLIGQENVQSIHYNHNDVNIDESHKPVTDKSKMYDQSHMTDTSVTQEMPQVISKEKSQVTSFLGETKPDIIISEEKRKTILYNKNEEAIKHQIKPASVNNETCKTIYLENNDEILSNTSKPHVIVGEEKCTTIIYENDTYLPEISVTKSLAKNKSVICVENSKLIYEADNHIASVSVSHNLNLQTAINKSISGESNTSKQSTSGKKSFLAQMLYNDSEISINFLDGKTCDNVEYEITCRDEIDKDQQIERIGGDDVQSNTVIDRKKVEVDTILTNQYMKNKSLCTTHTPILEEPVKETDNFTKNTNENIELNFTKPRLIVSEEKCITIIYEKDTDLPDISVKNYLATNKSVICEGNSKSFYEPDLHVANVSASQKQMNTDLNLDTAINKLSSGESNTNKQSTSGKKSFLAQVLNNDSEISIDFLDGKTRDNVESEITCPDEMKKNHEIELRTEEDNAQSNTVIDENKVEVDEIVTNQDIKCMTQAPILEESIKEIDNVIKNKTHILTKQQKILLDNTDEIIDMLTEAAEQIEQDQIDSAQKGEPINQQKIMTEESLEIVIADLDNAKAPKQKHCTSQNVSDDSGGKKTLTIACVNQAERIITLNHPPPPLKRPSWDITTHENCTKLNTQNHRAKVSSEVVKTLNFENESLEKSDYINLSITGYNKKCKTVEQENHPTEFEKDLSMTNFDPPLCSTQRFSFNPGYLNKYMNSNKAGLMSVPSTSVQDNNAVIDKTYNAKPYVKVPLIENSAALQVVATQQRDNETISKVENGSMKNTNESVFKEGHAGVSTKNCEEMLDNMSCITLVDDSMETDYMGPEKLNINTPPEKKEQTAITDRTNHIIHHTSYPTPSNENVNFTKTKNKDTALDNYDVPTRKRLLSPGKEDQYNLSIGSTPNPPRKIHKMSNSPISDDIDQKPLHIENKDIAFKSHAQKEASLIMDADNETLSGNLNCEENVLSEKQKVISQHSDEIVLELNRPNKKDQSFTDNRNMDADVCSSKNVQKKMSFVINSSNLGHNVIVTQMSISANESKKIPVDTNFADQKSKELSGQNYLGEKKPKLRPLEMKLSKNENEIVPSPENSTSSSKTKTAQVNTTESKRIPCNMHLGEIKPKEKHSQINLSKLKYDKVDTKMYLNNNEQKNICESVLSEKNPQEMSSHMNLSKIASQRVPSQLKSKSDDEQNKISADTELCETVDVSMEEGNCKSKICYSFDGAEEFKCQVIEEINNLHFIGTWVCKWAKCTETDWCFTLLHDRIRLCVRLEASGTGFVLPDTPVLTLDVTEAISDSRPVASQATTACHTLLRRLTTDACAHAGDVAALLTRCSEVLVETAAWARSMKHAKEHLAYKIEGDVLTLEVANVPLLSVWSLSLRLTYEATGPRANDVRVTSVCSKYPISDRAVESVLSEAEDGWDNVPQTVWKVFKYLKHKTKDEDP